MEYRKLTGAAGWIAAASIAAAMPAAYAQTPPRLRLLPMQLRPPDCRSGTRHRHPRRLRRRHPPAAAAPAPPPGLWINGIHLSAQLQAGIIANPYRPATGLNFGQLFTDHANQVQLNQLLLTANKPLDPKNPDYQWGFKVQFMYGSDARYTQFLGELNRVDPEPALSARRRRGECPGASAVAHRRRHRPQGRTVSDAARLRDDRSVDQSVLLALLHLPVRPAVQAHRRAGGDACQRRARYLRGIDTGTNTTFGPLGDNNGAIGGIGGFNLTFLDGNLTILALTHFGPEHATRALSPHRLQCQRSVALLQRRPGHLEGDRHADPRDRSQLGPRRLSASSGKPVNGFGLAQYASYALTDTLTLNGRAEVLARRQQLLRCLFPGQQFLCPVPAGLPGRSSMLRPAATRPTAR